MASLFDQLKNVLSGKTQAEKVEKIREFEKKVSAAQKRADGIISKAEEEAKKIKSDTLEEAKELRQKAEQLREEAANEKAKTSRQMGILEERERNLKKQKKEVQDRLAELEKVKKKELATLEKIASLTRKKARDLILKKVEKNLAETVSKRIKKAEEEIKAQVEKKAKKVLVEAMQRGVTDYVVEYTVSTVTLKDEEMKGRIIGREGRNIRAFERATGVELELDETNDVYLSSFDPVRREIARRALKKLIKDRRIRPSRIEEVVNRTKKEMDKILREEGEKLAREAGVYRLDPDLVKLLGRYKFRFSYGQNVAVHTLEVVKIAVAIAQEVGANVNVVRLAALLHDIGKVVTDQEGSHVELSVKLAEKHHLPKEVIECIAEHHEDRPFSSPESRIVWAADAISGARPGARYEPHEEYVKRMEEIENAASKFEGVKVAYAYQAGRDVRVLVKPEEVTDKELPVLAHKVRDRLEDKVDYVGQIKVTCIRETRVSETTKAK